MPREIAVFADESEQRGRYFSNFYGGLAVEGDHVDALSKRLDKLKHDIHLTGEVKWSKVTRTYLPKYMAFVDAIFDAMAVGELRMRIMFTQNINDQSGYTHEQRHAQYQLLYYQFLKHGFGLRYANYAALNELVVRVTLDERSMSREAWATFKRHIAGLSRDADYLAERVRVPEEFISQAKSHDHVLLQAVDVVLGSMQYKLNRLGDVLQANGRRGEKTKAKNELYAHIFQRILSLRPGYQFNPGVSTGLANPDRPQETWTRAYGHWLFKPNPPALVAGAVKPRPVWRPK